MSIWNCPLSEAAISYSFIFLQMKLPLLFQVNADPSSKKETRKQIPTFDIFCSFLWYPSIYLVNHFLPQTQTWDALDKGRRHHFPTLSPKISGPSKSLQIVLNWDSNPSVRLFPNSELERLCLWNLKQAALESCPSPLKPVMIWNRAVKKGKQKSHVQFVSNQKDEEST